MQALNEDVKKAIDAHLPQTVSGVLRERLEKADKDAAELEKYRSNYAVLDKQHSDKIAENTNLREQLKAHKAIDEREAAVEKREREAEIAALKVQLGAAEKNQEFARNLAMGLVRNIEFRSSVFESQTNRAMPVPQGGTVMQSYSTETSSKDHTQAAS